MHIQKVRDYIEGDLVDIAINPFSEFKGYEPLIHLESTVKKTLEEDGKIICIFCAIEYSADKWKGFMICSESIASRHIMNVKDVIQNFLKVYNVDRLETESVDCEKLNKWHVMLGFELEGKKRRYISDKDFNVWGIVHGN